MSTTATAAVLDAKRIAAAATQLITNQNKGKRLTDAVASGRAAMTRMSLTTTLAHEAPSVVDRFYYHAQHWSGSTSELITACRQGPFKGARGKRV